jgi:hypothetical protein
MENSAIGEMESSLEFDVIFSGMTVEDYRFLISMAKSIKARTEAEKTLDRLCAKIKVS